ncbi:hypothetical protein RKD49_005367 [Streptomyces glaucescens]
MNTYKVTFRDNSERRIEAKQVEFGEYGVTFTGRRHSQRVKQFVAFVPYGDLRCLEEEH